MPWLVALLLLRAGGGEDRSQFRYQRTVITTGAGESCAVIDPLLFAHAAESLRDLRLFDANGTEIPYVITVSGTDDASDTVAPVRNLVARDGVLHFDLEMPHRPFSQVVLDLASTDFVAVATVRSGDGRAAKLLGEFPVFDLSQEQLPRSTTLALAESTLPVLHVELRAAHGSRVLSPEMVRGATVPPSRTAQMVYSNALVSTAVEHAVQQTITRFVVPARVPIERVFFTLSGHDHADFNRAVQISARPVSATGSDSDTETVTGNITQLHRVRDGVLLTADHLSVPAALGANLQLAASVQVAIVDGRNTPLSLRSVALQSRERRICFSAPANEVLTLFYGDAQLQAPNAQASGLTGGAGARVATMGPEERNATYAQRVRSRTLLRRHPRLFTLGTLLLVCLVGVVALRSSKLRL